MGSFLDKIFGLEDRVAAITGGGGYLCSEMARGLAKAGCKIVVMDLRGHKAEDVARDIRDHIGGEAIGLSIDASDKNSFLDGLNQTLATFGRADFNKWRRINAPTLLLDITIDEFNDIMKSQITDATASFLGVICWPGKRCNQYLLRVSRSASIKGIHLFNCKSWYFKFDTNLGRMGHQGVRVNAIRPGFFQQNESQKFYHQRS